MVVWRQTQWLDCHKNSFLGTSDRVHVPKFLFEKKSFFRRRKFCCNISENQFSKVDFFDISDLLKGFVNSFSKLRIW